MSIQDSMNDSSDAVNRPTAVLRSPAYAAHDVPHHPENQVRLAVTEQYLEEQSLLSGRPDIAVVKAPLSSVEAIHSAWYVERLDRLATGGGAWLDADTYVGHDSYDVALLSAGAAVSGVDAVLDGRAHHAFALVRPPGHHAAPERGMGFCLLNNVAIGAARALERGLQRVAIVDWDVHHGNGTQDAFYDSRQVLFCSIHQSPFYPGTGDTGERGLGAGEGYTINVPIRAGQGNDDYLAVFDELFIPAIVAFEPELVLVSAGYDAHADDPLGGMRLSEQGFAGMASRLLDVTHRFAGGRLVAVLEGGYDPRALARSVAATIRTLDGEEISAV
jgi:acetoin utilization deacetylase AcuC-like enzyme